MSLFKTKEWWRTKCGVSETFDRRSLLVTGALLGADKKDALVVASHDGYLRIYGPSSQWLDDAKTPSGYRSTDLLIETKISDCIVDVKTGKFVSSSQDLRLAVLTPSKLQVYSVILSRGTAEHGDRCELVPAYEHALPRFPFSLTCGPFGGVRGRDFLCVQSIDGALLFYEQESYGFGLVLRHRLLPAPIVYVSRNDVFVTATSSWHVECYRYQNIAESGRSKDQSTVSGNAGKSLEPDWSYNIGEPVLDIDAVLVNSFEVAIVVLGERNLYCLNDTCASLKFAKRLEYKPVCFRPYVIEPDGKLMVLVIADTSTLMIYDGTTLQWSAQLPFSPVAVTRAHFQHLEGTIVILSEEGHLEACYLGSEPSLFIAPPLQRRAFDYEAAQKELAELRKQAKKAKANSDSKRADIDPETELLVSVSVSPDLMPCPRDVGSIEDAGKDNGEEKQRLMCEVTIELSSYTTLHNVQVYVGVSKPLMATEEFFDISNLCGRRILRTTIAPMQSLADSLTANSSEVEVTASYETDQGSVRVVSGKTAQLPLKMFMRSCPAENAPSQKVSAVIKYSDTPVNFVQLFPEFIGVENYQREMSSQALGLRHAGTGRRVTIVSGGAGRNRYRVQSNDDGSSMTLPIQQLIRRLAERPAGPGALAGSVTQSHLRLLHARIDAHFQSRRNVDDIMKEIALLTSQLRNIEKRLLRAIRERDSRPFSASDGLSFLLESTYEAISERLDDLVAARAEREKTEHSLQSVIKLLLQLLRLNLKKDKYDLIESAIGFQVMPYEQIDWEEVADVALAGLLRAGKAGNADVKPLTRNVGFATAKELTKLKKRLSHAIEQLNEADIVQEDDTTP